MFSFLVARKIIKRTPAQLLISIVMLLPWTMATGAERVMEGLEVEDTPTASRISVNFNHLVRTISYEPKQRGDLIRVQLKITASAGSDPEELLGDESLQWSPSNLVPLVEVSYESITQGFAELTFRFNRSVNIEVPSKQRNRGFTLVVVHPPTPKVPTEAPDQKEPPPQATSVQEELRRSTDGATLPPITGAKLEALMEEARQVMADKDYSRAIRIYTKVLQYPDHPHRKDAQEFIGLARERNGQLAHAKAEYEYYLSRFPEGESAERVRQRLAGLITARETPKEKLRTAKADARSETEWEMFGGFSQFYRRDISTVDPENDTSVDQSALASDMDITGRLRNGSYSMRSRLTAGYNHDFLDDGPGSDTRVSSLYLDAEYEPKDVSLRIGRQSRSTGGVLGRFDGLVLGVPLFGKATLSPVAGFPVNSSEDGLDPDTYFYGLSVDVEGIGEGWDINAFFIEQMVDDILDRRAVGGEVRYFHPQRSFFSLVDYDIEYGELNIAQFLGSWTAPDRTTLNLTVDYRKSPLLTTTNALIGQTVSSIDDLLDSFSKSEIQDLAEDRTATSKLATLTASRPITEKLQLSGDVSVSNFGDTPASGGIEAAEGTGNEFSYSVQLTGSSLIKNGDITIIGLRYFDGNTNTTTTANFNTRYPVTKNLRVNPRLRVDYRDNANDDSTQWTFRPSVRVNYRAKKRFQLELELGGELSTQELTDQTDKSSSYFLNLGYRLDF